VISYYGSMEVTPQAVASATFRVSKKGYDPDEVRSYLANVARALSDAHDRANHMETRARQAVARIQEVQAAGRAADPERVDDSTTISRTLLLAQKTADDTVAQARFDADQFRISARAEADSLIAQAHGDAEQIIAEARIDARTVADAEALRAEAELQQLLIRLEFLRDDVAHMEEFTVTQRERLLEAAQSLREVAERPVGGLGEIRGPVLHGATPHDDEPRGVYASLKDSWPDQDDVDDSPAETPALLGPGASMMRGGEHASDGRTAPTETETDEDVDLDATVAMSSPTFAAPPVNVPVARMFEEIPDADDLVVEEITAEVPIFQRPAAQNAMRFVGEEDV
jgi:DivIVA domain-containing protein